MTASYFLLPWKINVAINFKKSDKWALVFYIPYQVNLNQVLIGHSLFLRELITAVFHSKVFGLKMQKSTFFKKKGFECSFYQIQV